MLLCCLFLSQQRVYLLYFSLSLSKKNQTHKPPKTSTHINSQLHLRSSKVHKGHVFLLSTSVLLSCSIKVTAILILSWKSNNVNSSPSFQLKWRRAMWYKIITSLEYFFVGWVCCFFALLGLLFLFSSLWISFFLSSFYKKKYIYRIWGIFNSLLVMQFYMPEY